MDICCDHLGSFLNNIEGISIYVEILLLMYAFYFLFGPSNSFFKKSFLIKVMIMLAQLYFVYTNIQL